MHGAGKRRFSADSRMVSVVDYGVKNAVNLPLDYLVVPNNLLLSLSHRRTAAYTSQKHIYCTRATPRVTPVGKGIPRNSSS